MFSNALIAYEREKPLANFTGLIIPTAVTYIYTNKQNGL